MTRALTRATFHSSTLIRTLAELAVLETGASSGAVTDKLSQWIGFADAIALCAVHNASAATPSGEPSAAVATIVEDFARQRSALERSISLACSPTAGRGLRALPAPEPGAPVKEASAYEPYRRFHRAQQRDMALGVGSVRARIRDQVAKASSGLQQLVDLDAALESILGERESQWLATVPALLERRFGQLRDAHQRTLAQSGQEDRPDLWMKPGAWLGRYCDELQTVLLAELDLRLLPALGLMEALHNENRRHT